MTDSGLRRILLIVDGMGDLAVPELGDQTPLEAAFTPNLNDFARRGKFGLIDPINPGVVPNTDTGTSLLMGLDPDDTQLLRRGPIEAAGAGHPLKAGEVALRANFATAELHGTDLKITDRRAGRKTLGLDQLAEDIADVDLGDGVRARFYPTDQHRGVFVLSGETLDASVTDTDPSDGSLPATIARASATRPEASLTAEKVNLLVEIVRERLAEHPVNAERVNAGLLPANCVITRGAGSKADLRNRFTEMGYRVALVAGCNTVLGLGNQLDFDLLTDNRFTADTETDINAKVETAITASRDYDVVVIHVKAPDTCAHDQNPLEKKRVLERLDTALAQLLDWQGLLALSADHTTDSNTGRHTVDPVPSLLVHLGGADETTDSDLNFGESLCRQGNLERQNGQSFISRFLQERA